MFACNEQVNSDIQAFCGAVHWAACPSMLTPCVGCSGYDEYDCAVIIHWGRLMGGRRPAICRMFPVFKHHLMLTYLR